MLYEVITHERRRVDAPVFELEHGAARRAVTLGDRKFHAGLSISIASP